MINKAFKIIDEKLSEILLKKDFSKVTNIKNNILFVKNLDGYKVSFDENKNQFNLFECTLENNNITSEKNLSTWLFDPNFDSEKNAKDIASDFYQTIDKLLNKNLNKKNIKKKKNSDEENNSNPLFLMNRIASIFPELKNYIQEEKETYANFRSVTFAKEKVLPFAKEVLSSGEPKDKFKKLLTVFNNLYASGDLDTKAIITIVFLNSIDDSSARENIEKSASSELKIAMKEAYKLKGKKIKPEKIKKKSTFISDTLKAAQKN